MSNRNGHGNIDMIEPRRVNNWTRALPFFALAAEIAVVAAILTFEFHRNLESQSFLSNAIVLFLTQMIFTLYGAGLRRPFGSLTGLTKAPPLLHKARFIIVVADILFAAFIVFMWTSLITRMYLWVFISVWVVGLIIGSELNRRIPFIPSALIAAALGVMCLWHIASPYSALLFGIDGD